MYLRVLSLWNKFSICSSFCVEHWVFHIIFHEKRGCRGQRLWKICEFCFWKTTGKIRGHLQINFRTKNVTVTSLIFDTDKWKLSFDPDVRKQAQEVTFSRKQAKSVHPDLVFNSTPVHQTHCQKYLGVYLDIKLNLKLHIKEKI